MTKTILFLFIFDLLTPTICLKKFQYPALMDIRPNPNLHYTTPYTLLNIFDQLWSVLLLYISIPHFSNCAVYNPLYFTCCISPTFQYNTYLLVCYILLNCLPHNEIFHLFMIYSYHCPTVQCATYLYIIRLSLAHCAVYQPLYFTSLTNCGLYYFFIYNPTFVQLCSVPPLIFYLLS